MAISRALGAGSSSLIAHQAKFEVISNNLANASTIGFKSSDVTFADQLSQTIRFGQSPDAVDGVGTGSINPMQAGLGVRIGSITRNHAQGAVEVTNRPLDMAMNGEGMFVYNYNGRQLYSRAGAVSRDVNGALVDTNTGAFLQGFNISTDANGRAVKDSNNNNILSRETGNLVIPPGLISEPKQTQNVDFYGNIDREMAVGESKTTSIVVYDSTGGSRELSLTFEKSENENEYIVDGTIGGVDIASLQDIPVQFNQDGTIQTPLSLELVTADLNTAIGGTIFDETQNINLNFGDENALTTSSITNFSGVSDVTASFQDGYEAGELVSIQVDASGKLRGSFTNGENEVIGQVIVAKFTNYEGLLAEGGNLFSETSNSGNPNIGTAQENFPATYIQGSALEQSNVELTQQFTKMISTQRAFEAASRTITVSDQFLQELTNLKR